MRILIIEDDEKHILSAKKFAQECGHEVTIVTSYDEAEKALCGDDRMAREEPIKNFDVVMTDLFLPCSAEGLGDPGTFWLVDQPYGLTLALLAMRTGVKAVGIFTDGNHHSHPMIWALDTLRGYFGQSFRIGDATLLCTSRGPTLRRRLRDEEGEKLCIVPDDSPLLWAKDWMEFWLMLMSSRSPFEQL